jgi:DNA-binding beta-propeller fold protein YncE
MLISRRPEKKRRTAPRRALTAGRVLGIVCGAVALNIVAPTSADAGSSSQLAYVSEGSTFIDAFDSSSDTWLGQDISTGSTYGASGVAVAPNGLDTYVTDAYEEGTTKGSLSVISTATNAAVAQISLPESPLGPIAIAPNGKTAYVVAFQDVIPVDLATDIAGTPIPTPITGGGGDLSIAVTPNGKTAYVPTSKLGPCTSATTCYGVVLPIDLTNNTVGAQIDVPDYVGTWPDGYQEALSGGIAIAPAGKVAYVVMNAVGILAAGWVAPIDTATNTVGSQIPAGDAPTLIVITPNGKTAYVNNSSSDNAVTGVTPLDLKTNTPEAQIPRPACPSGSGSYLGPMAIVPSGATLYLMCTINSQMIAIDTATNSAGSPSASPSTYGTPTGIAFVPDQAPTAAVTVTSAPAGSPTTFNASSSSSPVGTIASYAWNFGDGHTLKTTHASITHTYATANTFSVTLTVTNSQGTSTKKVFTGNTMSNNGGPTAKVVERVTIPAG